MSTNEPKRNQEQNMKRYTFGRTISFSALRRLLDQRAVTGKKILRGGKNGYYQMLWRTTIITSFFVCFAYFFFVCPSPRGMLYIQRLQLSAFFKCILLDYYSKCLYVFSDAFLRRGKMRGGCLVLCGSNIETRGNTFCGKSCRFLPQSSIYEE